MLKLRVIHTRPSVDAPYFQPESAFDGFTALMGRYATRGQILSRTVSYDHADNNQSLKMIIETNWRSVADHEAYLAEPAVAVVRDARIVYCNRELIMVEYEREIIADQYDSAV
jgi:hypothetical protein